MIIERVSPQVSSSPVFRRNSTTKRGSVSEVGRRAEGSSGLHFTRFVGPNPSSSARLTLFSQSSRGGRIPARAQIRHGNLAQEARISTHRHDSAYENVSFSQRFDFGMKADSKGSALLRRRIVEAFVETLEKGLAEPGQEVVSAYPPSLPHPRILNLSILAHDSHLRLRLAYRKGDGSLPRR